MSGFAYVYLGNLERRPALTSAGGRRGAHGFVQLALDLETGEQVAIKFLERCGRKMKTKHILRCAPATVVEPNV